MPRKTPAFGPATYYQGERFNEAAARCRGKPRARRGASGPRPRFNEAAARCRGKRIGGSLMGRHSAAASMRPRPDAAENRPGYSTPIRSSAELQ